MIIPKADRLPFVQTMLRVQSDLGERLCRVRSIDEGMAEIQRWSCDTIKELCECYMRPVRQSNPTLDAASIDMAVRQIDRICDFLARDAIDRLDFVARRLRPQGSLKAHKERIYSDVQASAVWWVEVFQEWAEGRWTRAGGKGGSPPGDARHSPDFRAVMWYGQNYTFTSKQASCVQVLWRRWKEGIPDVSTADILDEIGEDSEAIMNRRLRDLFKEKKSIHPAWGTMIVEGERRGMYRLAWPEKTQIPR